MKCGCTLLSSVACLDLPYFFHIILWIRHDFRGIKVLNVKCVWRSCTAVWRSCTAVDLNISNCKKHRRDIVIYVRESECEVPFVPVRF